MTTPAEPASHGAATSEEPPAGVVVAGGAARRLGGVDKPMLEVHGRTLLGRSLDALSGADPLVVVGPRRPGVRGVHWTREEPPGTGPAAALAAGLALVDRRRVVVLAGDLYGVTTAVVARLLSALDGGAGDSADRHGPDVSHPATRHPDVSHADASHADLDTRGDHLRGRPGPHDRTGAVDGAVLVDADGRRQWLVGAWRTAALRAVLPAEPAGLALRRVLSGLTIVDVPARGDEATDIDTGDDLP